MPEIRDVKLNEISIPPVRSIFTGPPQAIPNSPPVTVTIGSPIVDIPGCVEFNPNGPGLVDSDPAGNRVLCDGNIPSFNPIEYEPNQAIMSGPPEPIPSYDETSKPLTTPPILDIPSGAPPDTAIVDKKEEKSIEVVEDPTFVEQYLPSAQEVTTTVIIAATAASAAVFGKPIADFLLKLIKPTVRKVIQKVKDKVGVTPEVLSVRERRQLQRDLRK